MMLALLLLKAVSLWFLVWSLYVLIKSRLSPLRKIPGWDLWNPLFGNMWTLCRMQIFDRWQYNYRKYGTIYRWHTIMSHAYVTVTSPDYIRHVLITNARNYTRDSFAGMEIFRKIVGDYSMLIIDGEEHRRHRSIVSPAFRLSNLRKLFPTMHECAGRFDRYLHDRLIEERRLKSIDIRQYLSHVTLTVIGLAGFGFDFGCIDDEQKRNRLSDVFGMLNGSKSPDGILRMLPYNYYYPMPSVKYFWNSLWTVHGIIDGMIKSKRSEEGVDGKGKERDLLDMILERTENQDSSIPTDRLSELELRDEVMTFIMAGHETSSLALTWTLAMLCVHPEYQERCRTELREIIPTNDRSASWDDLDRLKLCKAVVQETMRLYPPIPAVSRRSIDDDRLGSYEIPAGTSVVALIGQMHRLSEVWENPDEFVPERFLPSDDGEETDDRIPWGAYMPFGDGPHKCLGYQFAMAEIMVILATLLGKYRFTLDGDWAQLKVQGFVTLQPIDPILVNIEPID